MVYRRCPACRSFYDKKLGACSECGTPQGVYNSHLYVTALNDNLYAQATAAEHEARTHESVHRWAGETARELRREGLLDVAAHVLAPRE